MIMICKYQGCHASIVCLHVSSPYLTMNYVVAMSDYRKKVILKACIEVTAAAAVAVAKELHRNSEKRKRGHEQILGANITEEKGPKKKRSCWVKPWLLDRPNYGHYEHLMGRLRDTDPKGFRIFQRLSPEIWNELYDKVSPLIEKKTTMMRTPISAGARLAITLRFLATGDNYPTQMFSFLVASNTICGIIPETCKAIFQVLQDEYFSVSVINKQF